MPRSRCSGRCFQPSARRSSAIGGSVRLLTTRLPTDRRMADRSPSGAEIANVDTPGGAGAPGGGLGLVHVAEVVIPGPDPPDVFEQRPRSSLPEPRDDIGVQRRHLRWEMRARTSTSPILASLDSMRSSLTSPLAWMTVGAPPPTKPKVVPSISTASPSTNRQPGGGWSEGHRASRRSHRSQSRGPVPAPHGTARTGPPPTRPPWPESPLRVRRCAGSKAFGWCRGRRGPAWPPGRQMQTRRSRP